MSESPTPAKATPVPNRSSRRARLARLREQAEPVAEEERRRAIRTLLQQPLLTPDGPNAPEFILVRRHATWLADWFAHHTDWPLVVTAEAARLRKYPATLDDATRGAVEPSRQEPFTRNRYVLLMLALGCLERGERQTTLGRLAENILIALAADPAFAAAGFAWSLDQVADRRDFIGVLRLLVLLGVLKRQQGAEDRLLHDRKTDVLYTINRPVLAHLLATRRSPSLTTAGTTAERIARISATPLPETPEARNRALRTRFARQLLDDPVLYYSELSEEHRAYLDRQRPFLLRDLSGATELHEEVRREGIALADLDGDCTDAGLPEEGTEGHLTLLLATWLADRMRSGDASPVSLETIRRQTASLIRRHRHHWRQEVTQRGAENWLASLVIERLRGLHLVRDDGGAIAPLPALGRFALRMSAELLPAAEGEELFVNQ